MKKQTQTDKATARPWHFVNYGYVDGLYEGDVKTQDGVTVIHLKAAENDELEANASLIIQAVNEHAALVAVAEAAHMVSLGQRGNKEINGCIPVGASVMSELNIALANLEAVRGGK